MAGSFAPVPSLIGSGLAPGGQVPLGGPSQATVARQLGLEPIEAGQLGVVGTAGAAGVPAAEAKLVIPSSIIDSVAQRYKTVGTVKAFLFSGKSNLMNDLRGSEQDEITALRTQPERMKSFKPCDNCAGNNVGFYTYGSGGGDEGDLTSYVCGDCGYSWETKRRG